MVALDASSPLANGTPGKRMGLLIGGGCVLLLSSLVLVKSKTEKERGNIAVHRPAPGPDYITTDALSVVHRPAKNANTKGSQPSASKWA